MDWPRLTHLETDDLAHVLARAQVQPALATVLGRLTLLGNVGTPTWYGSDYNGTYSRVDTTALAMALQNGVLPNPPPAISHVTYLGPEWTDPSAQESAVAVGAILAAVPAITKLSFHFRSNAIQYINPVVQALSPHQPSVQHLRCVPAPTVSILILTG